jgi:hypothetical protein
LHKAPSLLSPGDLVAWAGSVLAPNHHPRLYDSETGEVIRQWPDLPTGESWSAITWDDTFRGPARIAIDRATDRLACTDGQRVVISTVLDDESPHGNANALLAAMTPRTQTGTRSAARADVLRSALRRGRLWCYATAGLSSG